MQGRMSGQTSDFLLPLKLPKQAQQVLSNKIKKVDIYIYFLCEVQASLRLHFVDNQQTQFPLFSLQSISGRRCWYTAKHKGEKKEKQKDNFKEDEHVSPDSSTKKQSNTKQNLILINNSNHDNRTQEKKKSQLFFRQGKNKER